MKRRLAIHHQTSTPALALALALMLVGLVVASVWVPAGEGREDGLLDNAERGCLCHGGEPDAQVAARLVVKGYVPGAIFESNRTYQVRVQVVGGPGEVVGRGGFNLLVTGGRLQVPEDETGNLSVADGGSQATHTQAGNGQRNWTLLWEAPANDTDVRFYLAVNSVNGDGEPSGDGWARTTLTLRGNARLEDDSGPTSLVIALIVMGGGLVVLLWAFKKVGIDDDEE